MVPALRKVSEGRGTHRADSVNEFKGRATRPPAQLGTLNECKRLIFSHALNWGRQYFGTKRSHTWKYVSALL